MHIRLLADNTLSDEQKESQRLEIEWKYGLLAAQRADEAIRASHLARERDCSLASCLRVQVKHKQAVAKAEDAKKVWEEAKIQVERLQRIIEEEQKAHKPVYDGYIQADARARDSFAEYQKKAIEQGYSSADLVSVPALSYD